jgi:hypothetical protein
LFRINTQSQLVLFADDTTISFGSTDAKVLKKVIEKDLSIIEDWLRHNRLIVNWSKTNFLYLGDKGKSNVEIQFGEHKLERVKQTKLLGVILDDELKFENHIDSTCRKVNKKAYLITRKSYLLSNKLKTTLFKLFIMPNLEYCSSLFINTSAKNIDQLARCYRKNLKLLTNVNISNYNIYEQYSVLKSFKLLPLQARLFEHFAMLLHSLIINNKALNILNRLVTRNGYT